MPCADSRSRLAAPDVDSEKKAANHPVMSWIMRNITAYKKWTVLFLIVVMSFDVFTGLRPLCASGLTPLFRALGIERIPPAIGSADDDNGQTSGSLLAGAEGRGGSSKCCCKKQTKCPAIPRSAITSKPTQRFNEVQREVKSVCSGSLVDLAPDHRLITRGDTALLELACRGCSCTSPPLDLTCVLLI